jgi:hypothetical protein
MVWMWSVHQVLAFIGIVFTYENQSVKYTRKESDEFFEMIDEDGDGQLTQIEIKKALEQIEFGSATAGPCTAKASDGQASGIAEVPTGQLLGKHLSASAHHILMDVFKTSESVDTVFKAADVSGDKKVDREEFFAYMSARAASGRLSTLRVFSYGNQFCLALWYGRAGRVTAESGGARPRADGRRPRGQLQGLRAERPAPRGAAAGCRLRHGQCCHLDPPRSILLAI